MSTLLVIPARFASSRLPGKPLQSIGDRPLIAHVIDRAKSVLSAHQICVATDDEKIMDAIAEFHPDTHREITPQELRSGTDRVAWIANETSYGKNADLLINLQGDEPFIEESVLNSFLKFSESQIQLLPDADRGLTPRMFTAVTPFGSPKEIQDPNTVKALVNSNGQATGFSRLPIPYGRLPVPTKPPFASRRHLGMYGYNREALCQISELETGQWEKAEGLEQLRALEYGIPIQTIEVDSQSIGVDSEASLEKAREIYHAKFIREN